jgi:glycosyltransferase involved in cell wall biosynthesis
MSEPARVVYVEGNTDGTIGGSYFSLLFLVQGLNRARYRPTVVFQRQHALWDRFAATADVRLEPKPEPFRFAARARRSSGPAGLLGAVLGPLQSVLNLLLFGVTAVRYARLLRREGADLLHLNNSITRAHDWMLAARLARVPCVVHERGINDRFPFPTRALAPRLDAVLCISQAAYDNLRGHGFDAATLHIVPNGLDPDEVRPARSPEDVRAALGIAADQPVIGVVGNVREWKGQEILIRALPAIRARVPGIVCLLIGTATEGDAGYMARINARIAADRLEPHVILTGYTTRVADYLQIMDVAVHTSITPEPFGRVLLEAMAMRKPVVGSGDGAVPEIVAHGVTGYTFTPGDPDELAARVLDVLLDPARARAFGDAGYRRLLDEFHIDRNVERTAAIYDRILVRPNSGAAVAASFGG